MARRSQEDDFVRNIIDASGLPSDGVVMIHSAFRSLSRAGWQAERFVEALVDRLSGATLLMPTMTWRTVTPEHPVFDELETPSHTGVLTEIFRTQWATARSLHPTHSVAGCGPAAVAILADHYRDDTPCSIDSPFGRLAGHDAWLVMLGVGLERCTLIHHAEETVAPELYLRPALEMESYSCRDRDGVTRLVRLRRHVRLPRDFPQFEAPLVAQGRFARGAVCGIPWRAFKARNLLNQVFDALWRKSDATLAA